MVSKNVLGSLMMRGNFTGVANGFDSARVPLASGGSAIIGVGLAALDVFLGLTFLVSVVIDKVDSTTDSLTGSEVLTVSPAVGLTTAVVSGVGSGVGTGGAANVGSGLDTSARPQVFFLSRKAATLK